MNSTKKPGISLKRQISDDEKSGCSKLSLKADSKVSVLEALCERPLLESSLSPSSFREPKEPCRQYNVNEECEKVKQEPYGSVAEWNDLDMSDTTLDTKEVMLETDVIEISLGTQEDLIKQEVDFSDVLSTDVVAAPNLVSMPQSTITLQQVTPADMHVSGNEESTFQSSPKSEVFSDGSDAYSECNDDTEIQQPIVSAQRGIQQNLPNNEQLPAEVATLMTAMAAIMDADQERLLNDSVTFDWQEDFSTFSGVKENFSVHSTGAVKSYDSPYSAFIDIFDVDIMNRIVTETNNYARQMIEEAKAETTFTKESLIYSWTDTNIHELYSLFAIYIYIGICQRSRLVEYWRRDSVMEMAEFHKLMSYDRYILLNECLYFVNDENEPRTNLGFLFGRLYKLHPLIVHLNAKFRSLYILDKYICIDESFTSFKGNLSSTKCRKTKPDQWDIKSFELCESHTGYLYKFVIDSGKYIPRGLKENEICSPVVVQAMAESLAAKTTQIVLKLLLGLERKGYHVTMDDFYNSPALARYLKFQGFDCLGTVQLTRKNIPNDVRNIKNKGDKTAIVARHSGDVMVMSWRDVEVISMISTYHDSSTTMKQQAGVERVMPLCMSDYYSAMGSIGMKNRKLIVVPSERMRGIRWYIRMFIRLLNASVHNSYILFSHRQKAGKTCTGDNSRMTLYKQFCYHLADELSRRHRVWMPLSTPGGLPPILRFNTTKLHLPIRCTRRRCYMCTVRGSRVYSSIMCSVCGIGLCVKEKNCFSEYHTLETINGQVIPHPTLRRRQK